MHDSPLLTKKVSSIIEESLAVPMWGKIPSFPWDAFCHTLKEAFKLHSFSLTSIEADWKERGEFLKGFGDDPITTSFMMAPLSPSLFWVMSKEDMEKLTKKLLDKEEKRSFSDEEFQKGFFRFSFLNVLKAFDHLKVYEGLSPKLHNTPLLNEKAYCIDIQIHLSEDLLLGRLICPLDFHNIFTSHFSSKPFSLDYVDSSLELTLKVQVGNVKIAASEWNEAQVGDVVILDQCSYHPTKKQGSLIITLETIPLFIAKSKNHELKILDYVLYKQEDSFMMEDTHDDEEDFEEDDFEDEEESDEDDEEFEDEEDEEIEEDDGEEEIQDRSPIEQVLSFKDVPLSLCVEVAHINMSLKQLLSLKPGNTLQLPISIEQGVTITLNSKIIARGELLQLGDLVGVKISEISH